MLVIPDFLPMLNVFSFKKAKEAKDKAKLMISDYEAGLLIQIYLKSERERMAAKAKHTREKKNVHREQSKAQHSRISEKGRWPDKKQ